jgi:hypothetical protein
MNIGKGGRNHSRLAEDCKGNVGGLVPCTLLLVQWVIHNAALRHTFMICAKDRVRCAVSSVLGGLPLQLSCTSARCQWGSGPPVSRSA